MAWLVAKDRLKLTLDVEDWIQKSESLPYMHFVPVDNRIALRSTRLLGYPHQDPADRIIIATALVLGKPIVTKDRKIRSYHGIRTTW